MSFPHAEAGLAVLGDLARRLDEPWASCEDARRAAAVLRSLVDASSRQLRANDRRYSDGTPVDPCRCVLCEAVLGGTVERTAR